MITMRPEFIRRKKQPKVLEAIKPCPFCGGESFLQQGNDSHDAFVHCSDCLASTNMLVPLANNDEEVIARWNQRWTEEPLY